MILDKNVFIFILIINISLYYQNEIDNSYINSKDYSIKTATYLIENRDGSLSLEFNDIPNFKNIFNVTDSILEIKEESDNFYSISRTIILDTKIDFNYLFTDSNNSLLIKSESSIKNKDYFLWKIIPKINDENNLIYFIQNKISKRFLELNSIIKDNKPFLSKITDISKVNEFNEFRFVELYKKVNKMKSHSSILENEPIDVLIKYIDLNDPNLVRTGIKQIRKDDDNDELKYSVRSILKYIPWIRKIFILMPNEKVRYFKPKEEIKDKIVYIKDKDLLGFDSGNSVTFQYNLYKMKQFGLSENFILMDDDYFIAKKINKSEFFYEEKGEIYPALVTSDYYEIDKPRIKNKLNNILNYKKSSEAHSSYGFLVRQIRALLFLYDIFGNDEIRNGKKLIEPAFSHNAIPVKMRDIKEIHDLILEKYYYGEKMLSAKERSIYDLQFQTLYMSYVKNKYDRKVSKIHSEFFDLTQSGKIIYNLKDKTKLFVINTSSKKYKYLFYKIEKKILNRLFPDKTIYENDLEKFLIKMKKINIEFIHLNITEVENKTNLETKDYFTEYINDLKYKIREIKNIELSNKLIVIKRIININGLQKMIKNLKTKESNLYILNIILVVIFILLLLYLFISNKE